MRREDSISGLARGVLGETGLARYHDLTRSGSENESWSSEAYIGWKYFFFQSDWM